MCCSDAPLPLDEHEPDMSETSRLTAVGAFDIRRTIRQYSELIMLLINFYLKLLIPPSANHPRSLFRPTLTCPSLLHWRHTRLDQSAIWKHGKPRILPFISSTTGRRGSGSRRSCSVGRQWPRHRQRRGSLAWAKRGRSLARELTV